MIFQLFDLISILKEDISFFFFFLKNFNVHIQWTEKLSVHARQHFFFPLVLHYKELFRSFYQEHLLVYYAYNICSDLWLCVFFNFCFNDKSRETHQDFRTKNYSYKEKKIVSFHK